MTKSEAVKYIIQPIATSTHPGKEYIKQKEAYDMAISLLKCVSPCDVCRFGPPSSTDGKPCTMCPAEGISI